MQRDTKPKPSALEAETVKVADLVSYQEGSIVSREILKKPTGTVTVFAFDEGQGLSEHTLRSMRWYWCWKAKSKSVSPESFIVCKAAR